MAWGEFTTPVKVGTAIVQVATTRGRRCRIVLDRWQGGSGSSAEGVCLLFDLGQAGETNVNEIKGNNQAQDVRHDGTSHIVAR